MPPYFLANLSSTTPLASAPSDYPYEISIKMGLLGIFTSSYFYLCIQKKMLQK